MREILIFLMLVFPLGAQTSLAASTHEYCPLGGPPSVTSCVVPAEFLGRNLEIQANHLSGFTFYTIPPKNISDLIIYGMTEDFNPRSDLNKDKFLPFKFGDVVSVYVGSSKGYLENGNFSYSRFKSIRDADFDHFVDDGYLMSERYEKYHGIHGDVLSFDDLGGATICYNYFDKKFTYCESYFHSDVFWFIASYDFKYFLKRSHLRSKVLRKWSEFVVDEFRKQ